MSQFEEFFHLIKTLETGVGADEETKKIVRRLINGADSEKIFSSTIDEKFSKIISERY